MEPSLFLREADKKSLRVIGNAPYGFEGSAVPKPALSSGGTPGAASSDGRWKTGERLYHDDYGYGAVLEIRESDEGPVIRARFDTGKEIQFLSSLQSRNFTKIGEEQ
jgi:DNA helicase-2/ATP-dependent DNA helicase PcrA